LSARPFLKVVVVFFASFLVDKRVWFFVDAILIGKRYPSSTPPGTQEPPGTPGFFCTHFLGRKKGILQAGRRKEGNSRSPPRSKKKV